MEQSFWDGKWTRNEIGFHQADYHALLMRHVHHLTEVGGQVLVPLCGKSRDMVMLAEQGLDVLGVEFSHIACQDFFKEQGMLAQETVLDGHTEYAAGSYSLLAGDFFTLPTIESISVTSVFDRASLIALDAPRRQRYIDTLQAVLPAGARILLISLEYEESLMSGPPFSVREAEIRRLFKSWCEVQTLERIDATFQRPGVPMQEAIYLITVA